MGLRRDLIDGFRLNFHSIMLEKPNFSSFMEFYFKVWIFLIVVVFGPAAQTSTNSTDTFYLVFPSCIQATLSIKASKDENKPPSVFVSNGI